MSEQWFVQFSEKTSGPFTREQLQKLATAGRLTPDTLVRANEHDWIRADAVVALTRDAVPPPTMGQSGSLRAHCACGQTWDVPTSFVGMPRKCPQCGRSVTIQHPASPPQTVDDLVDDVTPPTPTEPTQLGFWNARIAATWLVVAVLVAVVAVINIPFFGNLTSRLDPYDRAMLIFLLIASLLGSVTLRVVIAFVNQAILSDEEHRAVPLPSLPQSFCLVFSSQTLSVIPTVLAQQPPTEFFWGRAELFFYTAIFYVIPFCFGLRLMMKTPMLKAIAVGALHFTLQAIMLVGIALLLPLLKRPH